MADPLVYNASIAGMYSFIPEVDYQLHQEPHYIVPKQGQWIHFIDMKDVVELYVKNMGVLSPPRARIGDEGNEGLWAMAIKGTGQEAEGAVNVGTITIATATEASSISLPPLPLPEHNIILSISENLLIDYRQLSIDQQEWQITLIADTRMDISSEIFYPTLSWNPNDIGPAHSIQLIDSAGNAVVEDMRATSSYQVKHEEGSHSSHPSNEDITRSTYSYTIIFRPYTMTYYFDGDGYGYGNDNKSIVALDPPEDHVTEAGDCDDNDPTRYPGNLEFCNGEDDDCDDIIDEEGALTILAEGLDLGVEYTKESGVIIGIDETASTNPSLTTLYCLYVHRKYFFMDKDQSF